MYTDLWPYRESVPASTEGITGFGVEAMDGSIGHIDAASNEAGAGYIAAATEHIEVGVGVSCPIMRIHPAILAQAVATTGLLMDGRLTWGVGTGENLNEHVLGDPWPAYEVRAAMLEDSVD